MKFRAQVVEALGVSDEVDFRRGRHVGGSREFSGDGGGGGRALRIPKMKETRIEE